MAQWTYLKPAVSLKVGGVGTRYTCRIQEHETYIWREEDKWSIEAKGRPISDDEVC